MDYQAKLYLNLLKRVVTNVIYQDPNAANWLPNKFDRENREGGRDWPRTAHTMVGLQRLDNVQFCLEEVIREQIPGDFLEAGVWRGGCSIFARGVLKAYGVNDRTVWVADSFEGLPRANSSEYPADKIDDPHHTYEFLKVSLEQVKSNFAEYDLLDNQVQFLKGWFKDTLPNAPVKNLAVLRLDGDMYESTIQTLSALYSKVSEGGYILVDDYALEGCKLAVDDFRNRENIRQELKKVDWTGVFWRK